MSKNCRERSAGLCSWASRRLTVAVLTTIAAALLASMLTPAAFARQGAQVLVNDMQSGVSSQPPLTHHGGPVQHDPQVYLVFWDFYKDPLGERSYITSFVRSIGGNRWLATVNQYGAGSPRNLLKGTWSDYHHLSIAENPSEPELMAEVSRAALHFGIPKWSITNKNNINIQIVIVEPLGGVCNGHHGWLSFYGGNNWGITYTALPYNSEAGCRGGAATESHELAEAITDPQPFTGWLDSNGNEIADKCNGQNGHISAGGNDFFVEKLWSNRAGRCVLFS